MTGADIRGQISIAPSDPSFLGVSDFIGEELFDFIGQALVLVAGDPLTLDFATLPSFGQQFVIDEDIPGMPTGVWSPDLLSRASFLAGGRADRRPPFRPWGARIEEDGVAYTCMSSGGCEIEDTRVAKGVVLVSERGGPRGVAGGRRGRPGR